MPSPNKSDPNLALPRLLDAVNDGVCDLREKLVGNGSEGSGLIGRVDVLAHRVDALERAECDCADLRAAISECAKRIDSHAVARDAAGDVPRVVTGQHPRVDLAAPPEPFVWRDLKMPTSTATLWVLLILIAVLAGIYSPVAHRLADGWATGRAADVHRAPSPPAAKERPAIDHEHQ